MFSKSTKTLTSKEEYYYKKEFVNNIRDYESRGCGACDTPGGSILDSSLIIQTKLKEYSVKVVECGNYKSIYFYDNKKYKKEKNNEKIDVYEEEKEKKKRLINNMFDDLDLQKEKSREVPTLKEIEEKNINRAKMQMQRLVKTNIEDFKTFITLTFDTNKNTDININDIGQANKKFNIWKTYIKRLKKDFKYVCVPEFQKRGAVHYHLLTNLDYNTSSLLLQERKIWNKKDKKYHVGKDVKGWKYGISMAKDMKDINVVGYLTKYMTKEIDNRLFGMRRYHYSRNLKLPKEVYIDFNDKKDILYYLKSLNDMEICYRNNYFDKFGNEVYFVEYLKNEKIS